MSNTFGLIHTGPRGAAHLFHPGRTDVRHVMHEVRHVVHAARRVRPTGAHVHPTGAHGRPTGAQWKKLFSHPLRGVDHKWIHPSAGKLGCEVWITLAGEVDHKWITPSAGKLGSEMWITLVGYIIIIEDMYSVSRSGTGSRRSRRPGIPKAALGGRRRRGWGER